MSSIPLSSSFPHNYNNRNNLMNLNLMRHNFRSFLPSRNSIRKYILDWLVIILVVVATVLVDRLEPFHNEFSLNDKTISHPYKPDQTISEVVAGVISFLVPCLIIIIWSLICGSPRSLHHGLLGIGLSSSLTLLVVVVLKVGVGRHRPDWLSRCIPELIDGVYPSDPPGGLSNLSICTRKDSYIIKDGQRSFVSGHSGTAFSGLFFLSLFLAGKLRLFDGKGHTFKPFVTVAPIVLAIAVAITRIRDYRHHWQDVVCGSLLGIGMAIFSYLQYFHSPLSLQGHKALNCRSNAQLRPRDQDIHLEDTNSSLELELPNRTMTA